MNKRFRKIYWILAIAITPALSQAVTFSVGVGKAMGFGAMIAGLMAFFFLCEGIYHYRQGQPYGKDIVAVVICAGAATLCSALFGAFGMGSAVVTPTFN